MKKYFILLLLFLISCSGAISEEEVEKLVAESVPTSTSTTTTSTSTTTTSTSTTTTTIPKINYLPRILDINYETVSGNNGFTVTIQDKNNVYDPDDLKLIMFNDSRIFFNNGKKTYSTENQEGAEYAFRLNFSFNVCAGPISVYDHPDKTGVGCYPATSAYFNSPFSFDRSVPYSYEKINSETFKFGGNFNVGNSDPLGRGLLTTESIKNLKNYFKRDSSASEYFIVLSEIEYSYGDYSCAVEWKFSDMESNLLKIQNNELNKYYEKPNSYHRDDSFDIFGYDQKDWCRHLDNIQLPVFSEPYEEISDIKDGKITYTGEILYYDWYVRELDINKFVNDSKLNKDSRISYFEDTHGNKHLTYKLYP